MSTKTPPSAAYAPPEKRPGTPLFPEDKARQQRVSDPDHSGTTCGVGWAAWEKERIGDAQEYLEAVLYSPSGRRIKDRRGPSGGGRIKAHHIFASLGELRNYCLRWRMLHNGRSVPLEAVQSKIRRDLDRKTRRIYWQRRQPDVETHTRRDASGRTTYHHSVKQA